MPAFDDGRARDSFFPVRKSRLSIRVVLGLGVVADRSSDRNNVHRFNGT